MIGGLWNGITGLNSFEKALNVESNNASNVNTVGYKEDVINFEDLMYENNVSTFYGKGTSVANVDKAMYQQGGIKLTSSPYDVGIEGRGYFIVENLNSKSERETFYTRAGNFKIAENGILQTQNNMNVLGLASTIENTNGTNPEVNSFTQRYSSFIASQAIGNNDYLQTINAKATDYKSSAYDDSILNSGTNYKTKSSKINDIEELISDYKNKLDIYSDYKTYSLKFDELQIGDELKIDVNGKEITKSFVPETVLSTDEEKSAFIKKTKLEFMQELANVTNSSVSSVADKNEIVITSQNKSLTLENALLNDKKIDISNTTDAIIPSSAQSTNINISSYLSQLKKENDSIKVSIDGNQIYQSFIPTNASQELKQKLYDEDQLLDIQNRVGYVDPSSLTTTNYTQAQINAENQKFNLTASQIATLNSFSNKISNTKALTSSIDIKTGILNISSLVPGRDVKINEAYINEQLLDNNITTTAAKLGSGLAMVNSSSDALKDALLRAGADFLEMTNNVSLVNEKTSLRNEVTNTLEGLSNLQLNLSNLKISDNGLANMEISDGIIYMKDGENKFIVGKLQTAAFINEQGLVSQGNNLFQSSSQTGQISNAVNLNTLVSSSLEQSKANLANSLTALLIYQKAFEANSKSITTSDEMLQTAIQLKK